MIAHVVVVVPAADEQDEIATCLASIARARRQLESTAGVRSHVVVALDACTDGTAAVVDAAHAADPTITATHTHGRCVGAARRAGVAGALVELDCDPQQVWIANTDADCDVPPDWLVHMVATADAGADLVLGTVRPRADGAVAVRDAWLEEHDPRDGHPHVHGANLGVRASTYLAVGGWRELHLHEDVDLVERATVIEARIDRVGGEPVHTSSRTSGRIEHGFAGYLRDLAGRTQVADLLS